MKKKLVYSFLVVFALAVFSPAVVNAMDSDVQIVNVDADEKKEDKKTEKKSEKKSEKKATSDCPAEKSCCKEKKADCDKK